MELHLVFSLSFSVFYIKNQWDIFRLLKWIVESDMMKAIIKRRCDIWKDSILKNIPVLRVMKERFWLKWMTGTVDECDFWTISWLTYVHISIKWVYGRVVQKWNCGHYSLLKCMILLWKTVCTDVSLNCQNVWMFIQATFWELKKSDIRKVIYYGKRRWQ